MKERTAKEGKCLGEKLLEEPKASSVRKRKLNMVYVSPIAAKIHNEARKSDNTGVQSANGAVEFAEEAGKTFSRLQKRILKKQYAKAKREAAKKSAKAAGKAGKATVKAVEKIAKYTVKLAVSHPIIFLIVVAVSLLLIVISCTMTSCSMGLSGSGNVILSSTYLAVDTDILGVEADYKQKESDLQYRINHIESEYSGYDEYNYSIASIGHDAHELAAYLTAKHDAYTRSDMASPIASLFNEQYKLTLQRVVEVRYRQEQRTGYYTYVDEDGVSHEIPYTYYVTVAYNYYILHVTLTNIGINQYVVNGGLTAEQKERYDTLRLTNGNRPDLFN